MKSFNPSKEQGFLCVCFAIHEVSESFLSFQQLFRQAVEKAFLNTYVKCRGCGKWWLWAGQLLYFSKKMHSKLEVNMQFTYLQKLSNLNRVLKNFLAARIFKFCINKIESLWINVIHNLKP